MNLEEKEITQLHSARSKAIVSVVLASIVLTLCVTLVGACRYNAFRVAHKLSEQLEECEGAVAILSQESLEVELNLQHVIGANFSDNTGTLNNDPLMSESRSNLVWLPEVAIQRLTSLNNSKFNETVLDFYTKGNEENSRQRRHPGPPLFRLFPKPFIQPFRLGGWHPYVPFLGPPPGPPVFCCVCQVGSIGVSGPPGLPGRDGFSGVPGPPGPPGPDFPHKGIWIPGIHSLCRIGFPGVKGPVGPIGLPGKPGFPGRVVFPPNILPGWPGAPGPIGLPGRVGLKGLPGPPGPAVVPPIDYQGEVGPPGPKGKPGVSGKPGVVGTPGPPGSNGLDGNSGKRGTNGVLGIPGEPGLPGPPGKNGSCRCHPPRLAPGY